MYMYVYGSCRVSSCYADVYNSLIKAELPLTNILEPTVVDIIECYTGKGKYPNAQPNSTPTNPHNSYSKYFINLLHYA